MSISPMFPSYELPVVNRYLSISQEAFLYDGSTAAVPTFKHQFIEFTGAIPSRLGKFAPFKIKRDRIIDYRVRCCNPPLKRKLRFKCCPTTDSIVTQDNWVSLTIEQISTPDYPTGITNQSMYMTYSIPTSITTTGVCGSGCIDLDCCNKLNLLADKINYDPNSPVTATVVVIGTDYYIDIEAIGAGLIFTVLGYEGLTAPIEISPNYNQVFSAKQLAGWFDSPLIAACDPDKCMKVVEINYKKFDPHYEGNGTGTSDLGGTDNLNLPKDVMSMIVFDPASTNSVAAFDALLGILQATDVTNPIMREYLAIKGDADCDDMAFYQYCISRVDKGDDAALAAISADYPAFNKIGRNTFTKVSPTDTTGTSTYTISYPSATLAPVKTDTITQGNCGGECISGNCPPTSDCTTC